MSRPLVFDLTHLINRATAEAPSGIDRVDLAYGRHFAMHSKYLTTAAHYGRHEPIVLGRARLVDAVQTLGERWRENVALDEDDTYARIKTWLKGNDPPAPRQQPRQERAPIPEPRERRLKRFFGHHLAIPAEAIYLNVAQHALERHQAFAWMSRRADVRRVFFVHDMLPLDYPEFWWGGHERIFEDRVRVLARHASALITSTAVTRDRLLTEMAARGRADLQVFAAPLPSPIEAGPQVETHDAGLAAEPYFVVVSTIEPRKNHMLLFNVWRSIAASGGAVPKLIVVGKNGWESDQALSMLRRCASLKPHVLQVSAISNVALQRLVANACALLMPSFAEGYGLPLVEALALGAPVIASDIPVFREVAQEKALFLDPIDGPGWRDAVLRLADRSSPLSREIKARALAFDSPTEAGYFAKVEAFLSGL